MPAADARTGTRRVVTGHDTRNVAQAIIDGAAPNVKRPLEGVSATMIWCTDATPVKMPVGLDVEDMGSRNIGTPPPPSGSRFAMLEFAPGAGSHIHRTETLDYVVVVEGEIDMDMDESRVTLRAGDVLVQRGTNHAWVNRSSKPARLAIILIDGEPLGIGHAMKRADMPD